MRPLKNYGRRLLACFTVAFMLACLNSAARPQAGARPAGKSKSGATVMMILTATAPDTPAQSPREGGGEAAGGATVRPNAASEFEVLPGRTYSVSMWVRDAQGNNVPNSTINLNPVPGANNGGHEHSPSTRPVGTFNPATVNLPTGEVHNVRYTAPAASGQVLVNGSCTAGNSGSCTWNPWIYNVRVPDLFELAPGPLYIFSGAFAGEHVLNHWGTPGFNRALVDLAGTYFADPGNTTGDKLNFNDMSLPWGGAF
jgi:hypothetical protein